jgi:hypothetical protein
LAVAIAFVLLHNVENSLRPVGLAIRSRDLERPGVNTAMGTLTVPIWLAGAVTAVLVAAILLAVRRAGGVATITSMFRLLIVAIVAYAGWVYLQRLSTQDEVAMQRSLDERSAALMARAIAPGSALACLDELAGETVEAACEKGVFASPEAVAAAVSYVTAKLALLADGTQHAPRADAAFAAELVPTRTALELDRFGIVAHVLERHEGCTLQRCDALKRFTDPARVSANMRNHVFEDHVTKYTAMWNAPTQGAAVASAGPTAPIPNTLTPPGPTVSPRYDFPSAQSIPAVNIMAPEPAAPRAQAAAPANPASPGESLAAPVPPRRPPQNRVAAPAPPGVPSRAAAQPAAAGDPPTDGSVPRPAGSVPR